MESIKIGIIGCGAATDRYYVPAFKKHPHLIKNLYLVDNNKIQAEKVAIKLGGGEVIDDYRSIIDKVQGAIIVLPHFLHHSCSMAFLKAGVNVLCEKPLAISSIEAREMIQTAKEMNVSLCVNNTRRMFPSFKKVKEIIKSGQIGQVRSIKYYEGNSFDWPSSTGFYVNPKVSSKGALLDIGAHVLDLICLWLDGKPKLIEYRDDSFGGPESVVRIKAQADRCKIDVLLNRLCDLDNHYQITGELGTIEGELYEWNKLKVKMSSGKIVEYDLKPKFKSFPEFIHPIVDNFLSTINGKESPLIAGDDVLNSIQFIEECYNNRFGFELPWYENLEELIAN